MSDLASYETVCILHSIRHGVLHILCHIEYVCIFFNFVQILVFTCAHSKFEDIINVKWNQVKWHIYIVYQIKSSRNKSHHRNSRQKLIYFLQLYPYTPSSS